MDKGHTGAIPVIQKTALAAAVYGLFAQGLVADLIMPGGPMEQMLIGYTHADICPFLFCAAVKDGIDLHTAQERIIANVGDASRNDNAANTGTVAKCVRTDGGNPTTLDGIRDDHCAAASHIVGNGHLTTLDRIPQTVLAQLGIGGGIGGISGTVYDLPTPPCEGIGV